MSYIIYNKDTGEIAKCVNCPADLIASQCRDNEGWIEGAQIDDTLFYVLDREVVERPEFSITTNGAVISGVPEGTIVTIEGQQYTADGDDIVFEPSISGTYQIALSHFPYKETIIEVTI